MTLRRISGGLACGPTGAGVVTRLFGVSRFTPAVRFELGVFGFGG